MSQRPPLPRVTFGATVVALALATPVLAGAAVTDYAYVSPVPGSRLVSPWNNVALRLGAPIDRAALDATRIAVTGERSGAHDGTLALSNDGRTLVFTPRVPFDLGERVSVRLDAAPGAALPALAFDFEVAGADPASPIMRRTGLSASLDRPDADGDPLDWIEEASPAVGLADDIGCALPAGYPFLQLTAHDPEPGMVFLAPFSGLRPGRLMIVDNQGQPIFYRALPERAFDFKRQPDGRLTAYAARQQFWVFDSSYAVVDTIEMGNGYGADVHELLLLPNGNALLMAYDPQPVRMDLIVEGGRADATVIGLIIQEVDDDGNVVFQWRSWDHFEITDADTCLVNLRSSTVDYAHGNAIEVDLDGHLLISSRSMNEITKIDRTTGAIIWRLGQRAKNNQFSFTNDTRPWTAQHDIRVLGNGHYMLFDNGNCQTPAYSRALQFKVNERSMKVNRMWEWRHTPDLYAPFMGNAQRLPSGGTMIGWGGSSLDPKITEVHANGTPSIEIGLGSPSMFNYRAFRFPWDWKRLEATPAAVGFGTVAVGETATQPIEIRNVSGADFKITCLTANHTWFSVAEALPIVLPPGGATTVHLNFTPRATTDLVATLYARSARDTEMVAQPIVTVTASGLGTTDVGGPAASGRTMLFAARPSPFAGSTTIGFDLAQPGWVALEVFDLQGRKVDTLIDGIRPAGRHDVGWSGRGLRAGTYFYRLRSGAFSATRQLVLMR